MQDNLFRKYQGALLYIGKPHEVYRFDDHQLMMQIKKNRALFARYYTDSQLITPPTDSPPISAQHSSVKSDRLVCDSSDLSEQSGREASWWHCIRIGPISIEELNAKQRYRVRKGLRLNSITKAESSRIAESLDELIDLLEDSFSDYPKAYRPSNDLRLYAESFVDLVNKPGNDVFFVRDIESARLVGMAYCLVEKNMVELKVVKVRPDYQKNEVNAALGFEICRHYLNTEHRAYISDGERNIRHQTNYQDFLVRVLNFKIVGCRLHVVYHPVIKPIVKALFPMRKIIGRLATYNKTLYNIYCVLKQEEILRHCL